MDEVTEWQQRPLMPCYTVIYLDGIHYRTREDGVSSGRTIYTIYGVDTEGNRDILGLHVFKEVINEVYPKAIVQRCIVHMIRRSTRFVSSKHIKKVCADLRRICTAANRQMAGQALELFKKKWAGTYPEIAPKWEAI